MCNIVLPTVPKDEDDDQTGDSGVGTGSGSSWYGSVDEWTRAMKYPTAGILVIRAEHWVITVSMYSPRRKVHISKRR